MKEEAENKVIMLTQQVNDLMAKLDEYEPEEKKGDDDLNIIQKKLPVARKINFLQDKLSDIDNDLIIQSPETVLKELKLKWVDSEKQLQQELSNIMK